MALGKGILKGKKTYIVAILAVVGAIASYLTGDFTLQQTIEAVFASGAVAALRDGMNG